MGAVKKSYVKECIRGQGKIYDRNPVIEHQYREGIGNAPVCDLASQETRILIIAGAKR
jgi:hypothetical protein